MHKIVKLPSGSVLHLIGEVVPDRWEIRSWRANGVLERSARPVIKWSEEGEYPGQHFDACGNLVESPEPSPAELEEKRLRSLHASARRAKTVCRRSIIVEKMDEMLTLTYRENQTDRELCKRHFTLWVKRMKLALGHNESYIDKGGKPRTRRVPFNFRYVASFEPQERGAYHAHVCTHRLPESAYHKGVKVKAWEVGTRIWRDIVGANNGMCFVGGKSKTGLPRGRKLSLAKMANYVSKYILKGYQDVPSGGNRYSRSDGIQVGKPDSLIFDCTMGDLMGLMYECPPGHRVVSHRISKWADSVWLCTEPIPI